MAEWLVVLIVVVVSESVVVESNSNLEDEKRLTAEEMGHHHSLIPYNYVGLRFTMHLNFLWAGIVVARGTPGHPLATPLTMSTSMYLFCCCWLVCNAELYLYTYIIIGKLLILAPA